MGRILAALLLMAWASAWASAAQAEFSVVEASIADMQQAMASGRVTSRELVQQYLMRIALYDRKLHAVMTVNPLSANNSTEASSNNRVRSTFPVDT